MKKEIYLEHSTTTQRERSRDERSYEVEDSSQGFLVGPNQGTVSIPVEGRINIYIYIWLEEELLQISSSVSFLSFAFLMGISVANILYL